MKKKLIIGTVILALVTVILVWTIKGGDIREKAVEKATEALVETVVEEAVEKAKDKLIEEAIGKLIP
tara:strand:+ start:62 stop:262 length:201 start_codon:yes stop_codon:yes gene_type:complete